MKKLFRFSNVLDTCHFEMPVVCLFVCLFFKFDPVIFLTQGRGGDHQRLITSVMWKLAIIYSLALLVIAASVAEVKADETVDETDLDDEAMGDCGICRKEECPPASDCRAGLVLDRCGCCNVCGRIEGEKCDNYTLPLQYKDRYGFCGDNMACLLRNDMEDLVRIFSIQFRIHSNHPQSNGYISAILI